MTERPRGTSAGRRRSRDSFVPISKALSSLLRHNAIKEGVPITSDGWVSVDEALRWARQKRKLSADETTVRQIVETNDKQRFCLRESPNGPLIRANQGHSMGSISVEMQEVSEAVELAVHGTYYAAWPSIQSTGLSRMARKHVHLARNAPDRDVSVVSGMRSSCEVLVWVDLRKARVRLRAHFPPPAHRRSPPHLAA